MVKFSEQGRGFFDVEKEGKYWNVLFFEGEGMSHLARVNTKKTAEKIKRKYERDYSTGILLKPRGIYAQRLYKVV